MYTLNGVVIVAKSKWPSVKAKLHLVGGWSREGMLEKDIARKLGVAVSTFEDYKTKHQELIEALKIGKEEADFQVENSLFKKCVGSYAKEEKAFKCRETYYDESGRRCERETVEVVQVDTFIPPDTLAMLSWLNNRQPNKWRRNAGKERLDEKRFEHEKKMAEERTYF
jgi:hypothetical protein